MRKLLIVVGALLLSAGPAVAQTSTSYPPSTSSTSTPAPEGDDEVVTIDHGTLREGQSITLRSCGFAEDPAVFFNNETLIDPSDEIDAEGCATQILAIIEDGVADTALGGPRLAVAGAPLHLAQARETPLVDIEGVRVVARGNGRTNVVSNIGFSRDGDERFVRHLFRLPAGDGGTRGALARTGAAVVRWGLPGLALLGVGSLLVLAARRRSSLSS